MYGVIYIHRERVICPGGSECFPDISDNNIVEGYFAQAQVFDCGEKK